MEALRVSSVVPLGVPHAPLMTCESDIPFRGYIIPKVCFFYENKIKFINFVCGRMLGY
jgi:hypothetical protein